MAELTVALRAHNAAPYIANAIASVLAQKGVDLDLVVIDDGSIDDTRVRIGSFSDPRIKAINNSRQRGTGACYNLALEQNRGEFFATFDDKDILMPGALRKLVDACRSDSSIGMAHGYHFSVDADGRSTRDQYRAQRILFQEAFDATMNYQLSLLRHGSLAHGLSVYPAKLFKMIGGFSEANLVEANYDMAIRIAGNLMVKVVPEYLHCHRVLDSQAPQSRANKLAGWTRRAVHWRKLARDPIVVPAKNQASACKVLTAALGEALGLAAIKQTFTDRVLDIFRKAYRPVETRLYDTLTAQLAARSVHFSLNGHPSKQSRRIAYYTWHFPVLSQTFINRELAALKQSGMAVEVIADEPEDIALADDNAKLLLDHTHYLEPIDNTRLQRYRQDFFRKHPLDYLRCFFFVVARRYGSYKTIQEDLAVFSQAVYLAGTLRDRAIDHLHSPWSDRCAFVAMLAARLAGVTYSVQARAHDIHRNGYLFALSEKFEPARFVVTNTRYNEAYMKTFLSKAHWPKLTVIHNGLDLQRFQPHPKTRTTGPTRILCVARLIEQKGLIHLLRACAALRDEGFAIECEIVGGTEDIFMNYYLEFKRLRKQLDLEGTVRLSGSLPFKEVLERYSQADIFVLPCVIAADGSRDITPNALIEAMAMKLPVVSTTVTGVPEIVEHGVSGILVEPNDEVALTQAIGKLIENPELRKQFGEQARKRVEEKFDIHKNVAQYVELFCGETSHAVERKDAAHATEPVWLGMKGHHA